MGIINVWIEEGCIGCGLCETTCPDVFEVTQEAFVKEDAIFDGNEAAIKEAASDCPVDVIVFEED